MHQVWNTSLSTTLVSQTIGTAQLHFFCLVVHSFASYIASHQVPEIYRVNPFKERGLKMLFYQEKFTEVLTPVSFVESGIHCSHICNGQIAERVYTFAHNNITQRRCANVNGVQTCPAEYCRLVTVAKTQPSWSYKIQAQFADSSDKEHLVKQRE